MRVFLEKTVTRQELTDVRCNDCGRGISKDDAGYFEDHISLTKNWGYHSPFDGETHAIDLCADCYKDWILQFDIPPHVTDMAERLVEVGL